MGGQSQSRTLVQCHCGAACGQGSAGQDRRDQVKSRDRVGRAEGPLLRTRTLRARIRQTERAQVTREDGMKSIALACALALLVSPVSAQTVADFYRGKQIRVIVGSSPGDYDTWARVIVRHLRQHVPGNPTFVVENMPGAGSLIATNFLYSKAAQDGT